MKVNICYSFKSDAWGGGNQFLKALKEALMSSGVYEENPEIADVIIANSHHYLRECFRLKTKYPQKIIIHRVDGPISVVRGGSNLIDKALFLFNDLVADGTVFQTHWSRKENLKTFPGKSKYETIIYNAPDNKIFNRQNKIPFDTNRKIKLIATSWSSNLRKGFKIYQYLDEKLDFLKYQMTFVGNTPIHFKNIKYTKPVPSKNIAELLKQHDIYITASQNDPCSNSLIEALSCGLPAIIINSGGHEELIGKGGIVFNDENDILDKIRLITDNFYYYQDNIPELSIVKVAQKYLNFIEKISTDTQKKLYTPKKISLIKKIIFLKIQLILWFYKILNLK